MNIAVDLIGEVVESMRNLSVKESQRFGIPAGLTSPYYFYGHPMDINKQLIENDKDIVNKFKKYPAIFLRLPIPEEMKGGMIQYDMNIGIMDVSQKDYNSVERYTNVIKPILIPLYELFLDRLKKKGFKWQGYMDRPPHTKMDRPHHGVQETQGNKAYQFESVLDAIEIINLKVNKQFKNC